MLFKTLYYRHFNATQFLATPYFTLTKEFGDAWLFQFNASAALAAYNAAGPLPEFVDQWHPSTYINILASEGGYTDPTAGIYYGTGRLAVYCFRERELHAGSLAAQRKLPDWSRKPS